MCTVSSMCLTLNRCETSRFEPPNPAKRPTALLSHTHYRGHLREHLKTHHRTITSSSPPTVPARLLNISFLKKSAGRTPQISFLRTYRCFRGSSDELVTLERLEMLKSDGKALVEPAASMSSLRILQKSKP